MQKNFFAHSHYRINNFGEKCIYYNKGARELDQQWIIIGAKQCSGHLNKKNVWPIIIFLEQTLKKNLDQIPKNITHLIFGNEALMAALSNYSIQYLRPISQGSIYL